MVVGAFSDCTALKSVVFQEDSRLETIELDCFSDSGLEEFRAPPKLKEIHDKAFSGCMNLKRVVLNDGLEWLGSAFTKSGIEEITLPKTLKNVGRGAFSKCANLRVIYVEDGCDAAISGAMPKSVLIEPVLGTMCGDAKLSDLRGLRAVVIPEGVTRVGGYWFCGCDVESVAIPTSVTEIAT